MPVDYRPLPGRQAQRPQRKQEFAPRETAWEYFQKQAPLTLLGAALQPPMAYLGEKLTRPSKTAAEIKTEAAKSALVGERERLDFQRREAAEKKREGRLAVRDVLSSAKAKNMARLQLVTDVKKLQHDLDATTLSSGGGVGYGVSGNAASIRGNYQQYAENEAASVVAAWKEKKEAYQAYLLKKETWTGTLPLTALPHPGKRPETGPIMAKWNDRAVGEVGKIERFLQSKQWQTQKQVNPAGAADTLFDMFNDVLSAVNQDANDDRTGNFELLALNAREAGWKFNPEVAQYRFDENYVKTIANMQTIYEKNQYKRKHGEKWRKPYSARDSKMDPDSIMPALRDPKIRKLLQRFSYLFAPHQRKAMGLRPSEQKVDAYGTIMRGEGAKQTFVPGYGARQKSVLQFLDSRDKSEQILHKFLGHHEESAEPPEAGVSPGQLEAALNAKQRPSDRKAEKPRSLADRQKMIMSAQPEPLTEGMRGAEVETRPGRRGQAGLPTPRSSPQMWLQWWDRLPPEEQNTPAVQRLLPVSVLEELQRRQINDALLYDTP